MPRSGDDPGAPSRAPLPQWWWDLDLLSRRIVAGVVAAALVGLVFLSVSWLLPGERPLTAQLFVAGLPPHRVAQWEELAECESEGDWSRNSGNGYFGGLQFSLRTWEEAGGSGFPHESTRAEQIMRAERAFDLHGWEAWPRCSAALGFGP